MELRCTTSLARNCEGKPRWFVINELGGVAGLRCEEHAGTAVERLRKKVSFARITPESLALYRAQLVAGALEGLRVACD